MYERPRFFYVYEVTEDSIGSIMKNLNSVSLRPVPGTYKLHQIKTSKIWEIWYRPVNFTCEEGFTHPGHEWKCYDILSRKSQTVSSQNSVKTRAKSDQPVSK